MEILIDYFLLAFFITYIIIYLLYPKPKVILKYPSVKDKVSDLYVDDNNICYRYHRTQVGCPNIQPNINNHAE